MPSQPDPNTLFHLVPVNQFASQALLDPINAPFVSPSRDGRLGLEVGFHVPSVPRAPLITRLGQDADLNLRMIDFTHSMSSVHATFEFKANKDDAKFVFLSVQSKAISSVSYARIYPVNPAATPKTADQGTQEETVSLQEQSPKSVRKGKSFTGGGVIPFGCDHEVLITSYHFHLLWLYNSGESESLTLQSYEESVKLLSQYDPMECDTNRPSTAGTLHFEEIEELREPLGGGEYGSVTRRVDRRSGNILAVKRAKLKNPAIDRFLLDGFRREIAIMRDLNHPNVISFLGCQHLKTRHPEIFMPVREGNVGELVYSMKASNLNDFCNSVLKQMLAALDYTANEGVIHLDVKPSNILFYSLPSRLPGKRKYCFQLADFGLAQYTEVAEELYTPNVGTVHYMAPELCPVKSKVKARQSPKVDIWSLFATMVAIRSRFANFPPQTLDYAVVLDALRAVDGKDSIGPMGRLNPHCRASAAQMLKCLFQGEGLTTPQTEIPEIEPADEVDDDEVDETDETDEMELPSSPLPSSSQQTENDDGSTLQQPNAVALESGSAAQSENNSGSGVWQPSAEFPAASRPQRSEPHQISTGLRRPLSSVASTIMNRLNKPPQPKLSRKPGAGVAKRTASSRAARASTKPRRARKLPDLQIPSRSMPRPSRQFAGQRY